MIAAIGLMIAAYIITRMTSSIARTVKGEENILVAVLAGITIVVTLICSVTFLGLSLPNPEDIARNLQ